MKKILLYVLPLLVLTACKYDDTDLQKQIDGLDDKLTELTTRIDAMNTDIAGLRDLIAGKRFISAITANEDGGYTLTMVTSTGETSTITIKDGQNGTDAPAIGVKQDTDGKYYWTLNGEFILTEQGAKLPVSGDDGITPKFKIEEGYWYVSYDNSVTWTRCGKATGEDGTDIFKAVSLSEDGKKVFITLTDDTVLTFELYTAFGIAFDTTSGTLRVGEKVSIPFTLTGADAKTIIETLPAADWSAEVTLAEDYAAGTIDVTAPKDSSTGKVVVLVSDGDAKTLMRTLTFVAGVLNVSTSSKQATSAGGPVTVDVETDMDYTVAIPDAAQSWITLQETRSSEVRQETLTFNIAANTLAEPREAVVELRCNDTVIETILLFQLAYYDPAAFVLKVEAKAYTGTNAKYSNIVYLPFYNTLNIAIDWGDGTTENADATISTAATMLKHTYDKEGLYYVTVKGSAVQLNGNLIPAALRPAVVEIIQWGRLGLTSALKAFSGNTSLTGVPAPEAGAFAALTTVESMFTGCSALQSVPAGLLADAVDLTDVSSMFYNCAGLESIPETFFEKNTKVTDANSIFSGCKALTGIPAGLFKTMPAATNLSSAFANCAALTTVPADLFDAQTEAENLSSLFTGCTALRSIPEGLFKNQTKVTFISTMFKKCPALESIPAGLLDAFSEVTNMNSLFSGCSSLGNLPQDLFKNMSSATTSNYLYEGCVGMTEFPSLKNCTSLKTVNALWKDCSTLVSAPSDYFPENVKTGTTTAYMFQNCSALKNVPEDLFRNFEGTTIISQMFENCTALESLPAGLFDNMPKIKTASKTFNGCSAFTGESPYTVVNNEKVHLYERAPENGFVAITSFTDCFKNCKLIADYANIPIAWGGISDGTKNKPTLSLKLATIEGAEYYSLGLTVKATEAKSARYGLFTKEFLAECYEEMGSYEKVCNRNGIAFTSGQLANVNSEDGFSGYLEKLNSDTEYILLVSATNAHGVTVDMISARTAPYPTGDANYERYVGTWTVTSTSSEISKQPLTFTIEVKPYRINESYKVSDWGITTFGQEDTAPFLMNYETDGSVSISTKDPQDMIGSYYIYLKYRFLDPDSGTYMLWTSDQSLASGSYNADGSVTIQGKEFTNPQNGKTYTVGGMDYFLYANNNWYEHKDFFKPGYTVSDYSVGPYKLTKVAAAPAKSAAHATRKVLQPMFSGETILPVYPLQGAAQPRMTK